MRVAVRELKQQLSRYLAVAHDGEAVEVTSHKKVIARIEGVAESAEPGVAALLASGAARWRGGKPQGADLVLVNGGMLVSQMVLEDRL